MNFMIYWWGIKYSQNIFMFHDEWKYPMMMHVLHLNSITLFKWLFTINVKNFAIPSFTRINMYDMLYRAWNKYFKIYLFVLWFKILLQYDASTIFFLGFGMAMQNPSKFEKICYGAHCISRIIYKGYCKCIV